jgi:shikimate kinase
MNVAKRIFLIGLAGSGKTTLGKQLAGFLNMQFIDLDHEIEQKEGMSIPSIFREQGEGNFRIKERERLQEIISTDDQFVMATGGGTPCYHYNMDAMNQSGITLYLDVSPGDLALRVMDDGIQNRPMFKSYDHQDLIQEIKSMKEAREEVYLSAQVVIKNNQINLDLIVSNLKSTGCI